MTTVSSATTTVTIVLPVQNDAPFVRDAIDSVLAQTHTDWRLLVVEDLGAGLYATINAAVARIETEFVSILLPHDRLHPQYLAALASVVARFPMADAFWVDGHVVDGDGRILTSGRSSGRVEPMRPGVRPWRRALTKGCPWAISGSLTRRSLLVERPFRLDLPHCADYDWFLRMTRERPFVYYERPLIDRRTGLQVSARLQAPAGYITELCSVIEEQVDRHPLDLPMWRVCGIGASRAWQSAGLLAGHLAQGPDRSAWPLSRTMLKFLRLPPRAAIRRWHAWQPDLPAADKA